MKYPALFRRYSLAPIVESEYDTNVKSMFGIQFNIELPIQATEDFTVGDLSDGDKVRLYKTLIENKHLIAVVLVNKQFIIALHPERIIYININNVVIKEVQLPKAIEHKDHIPVGFEKTFVSTLSVVIIPGMILWDKANNNIYYRNEWMHINVELKECRALSTYHSLVKDPKKRGIIKLADDSYKLLN